MKRLWAAVPVVILAALLALFAATSLRHDPRVKDSPWIGKALPVITASDLNGQTQTITDGGGYILNVWASWCGPCIEEIPSLLALKAQGVEVRGLLYKDRPDKARAFLATYGNPYSAVVQDPKGALALSLGVSGAPESFIVGADGRVRAKVVGPLDADLYRKLVRTP